MLSEKENEHAAATRMRDACVAKVRELSEVWKWADENSADRERQNANVIRWDTANKIAAILESLTPDSAPTTKAEGS